MLSCSGGIMWTWLKTGRLCIKYFSPQGATVCEGAPLQNPQNLPQILLPLFIVCSLMEICPTECPYMEMLRYIIVNKIT